MGYRYIWIQVVFWTCFYENCRDKYCRFLNFDGFTSSRHLTYLTPNEYFTLRYVVTFSCLVTKYTVLRTWSVYIQLVLFRVFL